MSIQTKELIINAANELFAVNGFAGTSVRDIAEKADVNLAAINYHFINKENLYWQVFYYNYEWMKNSMVELDDSCDSTADFAVKVFRFFSENGMSMMNTFKIFLTDNVSVPECGIEVDSGEGQRIGPPGKDIFLKKIRNDVGGKVPEESLYWAIEMIFGLLVHYGVVINTTFMKEHCQKDDLFTPEYIENSLFHSVKAHLAYLKVNPDLK